MTIRRSDLEKKVQELIQDYCEEAEGQDGFEYWEQFETVDVAIKDFGLFLCNLS